MEVSSSITSNVASSGVVTNVLTSGDTITSSLQAGAAGPQGNPGAAATITVGSVTTGAPGTSASITTTGTPQSAVLNFTIPQGPTGPVGPAGSGTGDMLLGTAQTVTAAKTFNAGTLLDKGSMVFNVKAFGAVGDNTTDDTTAIQNAINAANTAGGGTVFLPLGTYKISTALTLYAGVNIKGTSRQATIINQVTSGQRGFSLAGSTANINGGLTISDLTLNGTNSGTADGMYIEAAALWYIGIRDVTVNAFGGNGVHLRGSVVSSLERVTGSSNLSNGIYIDGTSSVVTSTALIACYGLSNTAAGIRIDKADYSSLSACASDSNNIGYYLFDCLSTSLSGCGTESSTTTSYRIEGESAYSSHGVTLLGCYAWDGRGLGYLITGYADATLISCFDNQPHTGASYSLQIDANAVATESTCTWGNSVLANGARNILSDNNGLSSPRLKPRTATLTASSNTYTPNGNTTDLALIVSPTAAFTVANPTGTPVDGQKLMLRIESGTTGYAPTWGALYQSSGVATLPSTALPASKTITLGFTYDATAAKWVLLALDGVGY